MLQSGKMSQMQGHLKAAGWQMNRQITQTYTQYGNLILKLQMINANPKFIGNKFYNPTTDLRIRNFL
jgi:hypothetical protein